jgi:Poly(ADP-ribose) polymerase and DNA-Ligase Zn-finger region
MPHTIEPATSGRAKCRGCGQSIAKGELRFGERLPNPFADDSEMTLWFHIPCAAYKRPESLQEVIGDTGEIDNIEVLKTVIAAGIARHRLPGINGLQLAPSGRSKCRNCHEMIAKEEWRIPLVHFEEGMFSPSGFIHLGCTGDFFETTDVMDRLLFFAAELEEDQIAEVKKVLGSL